MRRVLIISLTGALALPIFADEPKKEAQPQSETQAVAPAAGDSLMVQAAKRANRRNPKKGTILITNETLRSSKGHITTTAAQAPLNVPEPKAGPEQELREKMAKRAADRKRIEDARAEAARKAAEHRGKLRRDAAEQAEEGLYEDPEGMGDPAVAEHAAETAGDPKPPL
ncbi:MAG TPA: hypothetical protein VE974_04215 [Thermoanaerobaculia bacterium]|nr:hypothetical protein [Thermoanaerobaculia bacterium]